MKKIIFLPASLFLVTMLYGQNSENIILNGGWKLYYGPHIQNAPATPDELNKMNWPVIPAIVPGNVINNI